MNQPSEVASWLEDHLQSLELSEEAEGYLYGRGAREESIASLGIKEWRPATTTSPSPHFRARYQDRGQRLDGYLVVPLRGPTGRLVGIEARSRFEKKITEFRLPEASWNPVLLNAPETAQKLWNGGSVWVVEGLFDLLALMWVVPSTDAVLATLKAGLAKNHVEFLARFCTNTVYMVYDNDKAGRNATNGYVDHATNQRHLGALELLTRAGLKAVDYRYGGKDPGEVWSSGGYRKLQQMFQPFGDSTRP